MSNSDNQPLLKRSPIPMEDCGMALAATVIGDRWSLLILRALLYGVRRFDDLKADLNISSATLTQRLAKLDEVGLITARPYRDGNARTRKEYVLTAQGAALRTVLFTMMRWADVHLSDKPSSLTAVSKSSGETLDVAFVDPGGRVVEDSDIEMQVRALPA